MNEQYKIIADNLGEYSVLRPDGSMVITEIKNKARAELFCDELNNLLKENMELQGKASSWKITASEEISEKGELIKQISELKEENEELKQFKKDVFNKIDRYLQMLPSIRGDEINRKYNIPKVYKGAIDMLEILKKELKE